MERNRIDHNHMKKVGKRAPTGAALMQARVTDSLTRALFVEWAERGFAALSLEAVAKRAGVGKAALYRRWPSKLAMISDRLNAVGVGITDIPNQGSLARDIRAALLDIRKLLRHPLIRRILPDLHAELARSPDLREVIRPIQAARRARAERIIHQAIARGELPENVHLKLASDVLAAPLYWRIIVIGNRADLAYIDVLTVAIVAMLQATPPVATLPDPE